MTISSAFEQSALCLRILPTLRASARRFKKSASDSFLYFLRLMAILCAQTPGRRLPGRGKKNRSSKRNIVRFDLRLRSGR